MIRSRDFFLYVVALAFVVLAATYTGFSQKLSAELSQLVLFNDPVPVLTGTAVESVDDRAARLRAMQASIAAGDGVVADAPPDFVSVDQLRAAEAASTSDSNSQPLFGSRTVTYCGVSSTPTIVATWPTQTELRTSEGERIVFSSVTEQVTVGSTTQTQLVQLPFVSLPIRSVRTSFDSCLGDTLIGVTPTGAPLLNTSARQYVNTNQATLIGYTRDGFSLYGPLAEESVLDACGGYYVNGRYQYHVRTAEDFILACYAGVPVSI